MKSFEKGWTIFLYTPLKLYTVEIVHTLCRNCSHPTPQHRIWKTILKFFAALFLQLWNFRVFLFLTFFAKSINKVTRGDYVSWGAIVKIIPKTEIWRYRIVILSLHYWCRKADYSWPDGCTPHQILSRYKMNITTWVPIHLYLGEAVPCWSASKQDKNLLQTTFQFVTGEIWQWF